MKSVLISFGAPRSGTTFMERMFGSHEGDVCYAKMAEWSPLHPMNSSTGLMNLSTVWRQVPVVFVRTVRHPLDIMASWPYLDGEILLPERFEEALNWIRLESENYWIQEAALRDENKRRRDNGYTQVRVVSVLFDRLGDPALQSQFFGWLDRAVPDKNAVEAWSKFCAENWGKRPVRAGRLQGGDAPKLSDEQIDTILRELAKVIKREGVEDVSPFTDERRGR